MRYLEKITIKDKTGTGTHVLKKGFSFNCSDVNIFVGDQGCGKSTLINLIRRSAPDLTIETNAYVKEHGVKSFFFDSEKHNPRTTDPEMYTTPSGQDVGIGFKAAYMSRFRSHGEVLQDMTVAPLYDARDCVILLDEPESGLSVTNQFKLIRAIQGAVKNN